MRPATHQTVERETGLRGTVVRVFDAGPGEPARLVLRLDAAGAVEVTRMSASAGLSAPVPSKVLVTLRGDPGSRPTPGQDVSVSGELRMCLLDGMTLHLDASPSRNPLDRLKRIEDSTFLSVAAAGPPGRAPQGRSAAGRPGLRVLSTPGSNEDPILSECAWLLSASGGGHALFLSPAALSGRTGRAGEAVRFLVPDPIRSIFRGVLPPRQPGGAVALGGSGPLMPAPAMLESSVESGRLGTLGLRPSVCLFPDSEGEAKLVLPWNPLEYPLALWQSIARLDAGWRPPMRLTPWGQASLTARHEIGHILQEAEGVGFEDNLRHDGECFADAVSILSALVDGVPEDDVRALVLARKVDGATLCGPIVYATGLAAEHAMLEGLRMRRAAEAGAPRPSAREIARVARESMMAGRIPDAAAHLKFMKERGLDGARPSLRAVEEALSDARAGGASHATRAVLSAALDAMEACIPPPAGAEAVAECVDAHRQSLAEQMEFLASIGLGRLAPAARRAAATSSLPQAALSTLHASSAVLLGPVARMHSLLLAGLPERASRWLSSLSGFGQDAARELLSSRISNALAAARLPRARPGEAVSAPLVALGPGEAEEWPSSPSGAGGLLRSALDALAAHPSAFSSREGRGRVADFRDAFAAAFGEPEAARASCILLGEETARCAGELHAWLHSPSSRRGSDIRHRAQACAAMVGNALSRPWAEAIALHAMWTEGLAAGRRMNLENARVEGAMFHRVNLDMARIRNCSLVRCSFEGVHWGEADLEGTLEEGCVFRDCDRPAQLAGQVRDAPPPPGVSPP